MRPQSARVFFIALIAAASSVAVRAGDEQSCGSLRSAFQAKPCPASASRPWQVDFGAAKLPPLLPEQRMTHQGLKTVVPAARTRRGHGTVYNPSGSGFQNAFVRGLNIIRAPVEKTPIDCAMAKPGDPSLDRSMVRQVHGHVRHSGVIVAVARCR
jgi:hypothetical protein